MENENDLPVGDEGVEDVPQDDTEDAAAAAAGNKDDDDDDDDDVAAKKPVKGGAAAAAAAAKISSNKKPKKKYPKKAKKSIKKKPDDMPRRPLSAYNYFFSEMRTKLLADRAAAASGDTGIDGTGGDLFREFMASDPANNKEVVPDVTKKNGFFSNMGKFVAQRWKSLQGTDEIKVYTGLAEQDLARYRKEMDEYREGVARKTRLASEQRLLQLDQKNNNLVDVVSQQMSQQMVDSSSTAATAAAAGTTTTNQPVVGWPATASSWGLVPGQPAAAAPPSGGAASTVAAPYMPGAAPAAEDPQLQMFLRQQAVLAAQNPQLNAFLLQQQYAAAAAAAAAAGGIPGYAPQFAQFYGQQQAQQAAQQQHQNMMMMMGGVAGYPGGMIQNPGDLYQYNFGAGGAMMYPPQPQQHAQPHQALSAGGGEVIGFVGQDGQQYMVQQQQQQQQPSHQGGVQGQELGNDSFM